MHGETITIKFILDWRPGKSLGMCLFERKGKLRATKKLYETAVKQLHYVFGRIKC